MHSPPDRLPPGHPLLALLQRHARVLLIGAPGSGKSTLACAAAASLADEGRACLCLSADPGLPGVGPPGAVCLGRWNPQPGEDGRWRLEAMQALATLDSARFRLPLVEAVRRLADLAPNGPLLLDAPGVVRGAAGAELLPALAAAGRVSALVMLAPDANPAPLSHECRALDLEQLSLTPDPRARHPGRSVRTRRRTDAWNAYLATATEQALDLSRLAVVGTPPPRSAPDAWRGRQVGLLDAHGRTLALGEVLALDGTSLRLRAPPTSAPACTLVIRDAQRRGDGQLGTARPHLAPTRHATEPADTPAPLTAGSGARPQVRLTTLTATLVNGAFGDPLLHLRLRHQKRSLLFDLGDPGRLPARLAHQVTDVFISHAHFDHIGGFPWLLRSRIGDFPTCRFYGPPGLADHLAGQIRGVLWDRVGDKAPRFEVSELHGERLERWRLTAGEEPTALPPRQATEGVLHEELGFRVRAATLDHGTPVLAFAFEPDIQVKVRKERLEALGWPPGPWLGELKHLVLAGDGDSRLTLPNGEHWQVARLMETLLLTEPGQRLVYATDLGDTAENRRRLVALARRAQVLFCEAPFLSREAEQARLTGHLTARACGEIAAAAGVDQLIPFHFSRRHAGDAQAIHDEVRTRFAHLLPAADAP
ncbi:Clp1/GlmU family protein [Halomonas sp. C05BenzN]|uniref:Clp1/GlmU family protein n=1 Tax=Halomonas sp. C05BenzN TaxID=3411041 RepID=UPI003B95E4AC